MNEDHGSDMTVEARDGNGRFTRSIETAKRDAEAATLKSRNMTYEQVAEALGVTPGGAYKMVQRALRDAIEEPADSLRQLELVKLDRMESAALAVMERTHWAHSNGRLVYMGENPLEDDGPALAAVNTLLKVQERRAKLMGLDSPVKLAVSGIMRYELDGVNTDDV